MKLVHPRDITTHLRIYDGNERKTSAVVWSVLQRFAIGGRLTTATAIIIAGGNTATSVTATGSELHQRRSMGYATALCDTVTRSNHPNPDSLITRFHPTGRSVHGTLSGMMPDERPSKSDKTRTLLSVPLTHDQKSELVRRAGAKPVSAYARDLLFPANDNPAPRRVRRRKGREQMAALLLAQLGTGEAANSLREIAPGVRLCVRPQ